MKLHSLWIDQNENALNSCIDLLLTHDDTLFIKTDFSARPQDRSQVSKENRFDRFLTRVKEMQADEFKLLKKTTRHLIAG